MSREAAVLSPEPKAQSPEPKAEIRTFTNAVSGRVIGWTAGPFLVAAIIVAAQAGWIISAMIAVIGLGLAVFVQTCLTQETVICSDTCVTVLIADQPDPASARVFRWEDVKSTRYAERTVLAGAHDCTIGVFNLEGQSGVLLEVTSNWGDLADIIATCNERTPHLRFSWEPCRSAPPADVLERVGDYCRVARLRAQYSHLP